MRKRSYSLEGINGNAFCIMAYVQKAMKEVGLSDELGVYRARCVSWDYDNLLVESLKMIDRCNKALCHKDNHPHEEKSDSTCDDAYDYDDEDDYDEDDNEEDDYYDDYEDEDDEDNEDWDDYEDEDDEDEDDYDEDDEDEDWG